MPASRILDSVVVDNCTKGPTKDIGEVKEVLFRLCLMYFTISLPSRNCSNNEHC